MLDFSRPPGSTTAIGVGLSCHNTRKSTSETFVGGSTDGSIGAVAQALSGDGVTARKAWLLFDAAVIALGEVSTQLAAGGDTCKDFGGIGDSSQGGACCAASCGTCGGANCCSHRGGCHACCRASIHRTCNASSAPAPCRLPQGAQTSIEQTRLTGPVTIGTTNGSVRTLVPDLYAFPGGAVSWIHHNRTGYLLLGSALGQGGIPLHSGHQT